MSDHEGVKKVRCPACRKSFLLPQDSQSITVNCPHCKQPLKTGSERTGKEDPLIGKRFLHYKVLRRLGRGSMGRVYACEDSDGSQRACKILSRRHKGDEELLERFRREARLSCKLQHPNLVRGFEFGEEHKAQYLVMELAVGTGLDELIATYGAFDWKRAGEIMLQISSALGYLVSEGVIHRDVKPENIMVDEQDNAKLLDLGFAKILGDSNIGKDEMKELTMVGTALGSPAYMAPEQILDSSTADPATDVYNLGASFYHVLTGRLPYDGKTAMSVMDDVLHKPLLPPGEVRPDLPRGLNAFVLWAMEKDAKRRPRDCRVFHQVLAQVLEQPDDERVVLRAAGASGMLRWILVVIGLLVLGVVGYLVLRHAGL